MSCYNISNNKPLIHDVLEAYFLYWHAFSACICIGRNTKNCVAFTSSACRNA